MKKGSLGLIVELASLIGLAVTVYFAVDETKDEQSEEEEETDISKKIIRKVKQYKKTIIGSLVTAGLIIWTKKITVAQVASVCAGGLANGDKIKQGMTDILTTEKGDIFLEATGRGNEICYEPLMGRYFKSSKADVERAQHALSDQVHQGAYVSIYDYYRLLGLQAPEMMKSFGWSGWPEDEPFWEDILFINHYVKIRGIKEKVLMLDMQDFKFHQPRMDYMYC